MPSAENLFLLVISMLALDSFRSIRFAWMHIISRLTGKSLNSFYYTLSYAAFDHLRWTAVTARLVLSCIPISLRDSSVFLSIDDTLVEKYGTKFQAAQTCLTMPPITAPITLRGTASSVSCSMCRLSQRMESLTSPFPSATACGRGNFPNWSLPQTWYVPLWRNFPPAGRSSFCATAGIPRSPSPGLCQNSKIWR